MEKELFGDLEDILETILPDSSDSVVLTDEFRDCVLDIIHEYMQDNVHTMMDEDFHEVLLENIFELVRCQFEKEIKFYEYELFQDKIIELVEEYYDSVLPGRSCSDDYRNNKSIRLPRVSSYVTGLQKTLNILRAKPQPEQRTAEWYSFRHNLITASNAYKTLMEENCSEYNQIIYEKCQPLKVPSIKEDENSVVNVDTTLHWGQKIEPISVLIYEDMYCTTIEDFGCVQHSNYKFIGASPDGINVSKRNPEFYGRMLEIKNIVNRDITGIPKLEYWVQMQLQMETSDLPECDFFETRIKEYENETKYLEGMTDDTKLASNINTGDTDCRYQGVIMYFSKKGKPVYRYSPLNIKEDELRKWEDDTRVTEDETPEMVWVKNIYWYLEEFSCVLVMRNKKWFSSVIPIMSKAWDTIEKERVTGYEHRAPMKRTPKKTKPSDNMGCLLTINKSNESVAVNDGTITSCFNLQNMRIRTESMDETRDKMNSPKDDENNT